ncbi:unnamed protein product [Natator depressus]
MQRLCADSLDVGRPLRPPGMPSLVQAPEVFSWMTYSAEGMNPLCCSACIEGGAHITVATVRMPVSSAQLLRLPHRCPLLHVLTPPPITQEPSTTTVLPTTQQMSTTTTAPPDNTEAPKTPVALTCLPDYMRAVIRRAYIRSKGYFSWNVHLNDPACRPVVTKSHVIFHIPYDGCGTKSERCVKDDT